MKSTVTTKWLKEHINDNNIVVIDCRFDLADRDYGKRSYKENHIKNSVRVDIESDLSRSIEKHGGRHPLPDVDELKVVVENLGIKNDSIVVCYSDIDLAGAARFWWILKYLGHQEVYVLNGDIKAFAHIGGEISEDEINIETSTYNINLAEDKNVDMNYVKSKIGNNDTAIVDSREIKRYSGEFEPIDKKAGHIPGAINYFWMDVLNEGELKLKSEDELRHHFDKLNEYKEVIVYCGSGITACTNSLALSQIGIEHKVYSGSFSDWISYDDNKIETI